MSYIAKSWNMLPITQGVASVQQWQDILGWRIYQLCMLLRCNFGTLIQADLHQIVPVTCSTPVHCSFQVAPQLDWVQDFDWCCWDTFLFLCHCDVHLDLCLGTLTFWRKNAFPSFFWQVKTGSLGVGLHNFKGACYISAPKLFNHNFRSILDL